MSNIRYEFVMSQIKHIRDIKENEKTKISLVFYEGCQGPCILKICKNRDLSEVYQALMGVQHPNVAQVYDCICENGNTYIIEEYIPGKTLAEILAEKGTFSEKETAEIMAELCSGLDELHRQEPPIIHNDIKTSNIMIKEDGNVILFDFDISRIYKEGSYKNTKLMGTYEYAAPEHYGFGQSDPRTDIYSLGVTMHEMLTGVGLDQKHKVTYQGPLAKIIEKCVKIDSQKRYASAALLKSALEKYKEIHSRKWGIILACICGALLLLLGGVFLSNHLSANPDNDDKIPGLTDDNWQEGSEIEGIENTEGNIETEGAQNTEGVPGTEGVLGDEGSTGTQGNTGNAGNVGIGGNTGNTGNLGTGGNTGSTGGSGIGGNTGNTGGSGIGGNTENIGGSSTEGNNGNIGESGGGNSSTEDTSKPEEDNTQNDSSEDNTEDTGNSPKSYKLLYDPKDVMQGMATWANGTSVLVEKEKESGKYWLRSTTGKEKSLDGFSVTKGATLARNPYTDQVYLFLYNDAEHSVYSVSKNLEIKFVKTLNFTNDARYADILFYPDGTIGYTYHNKLVDSKNWTVIGDISSSQWKKGSDKTYIINGKVYTIDATSTGVFKGFLEWDSNGNLVKDYPGGDFKLFTSYNLRPTNRDVIYASGDALYARATLNGEKVFVRFDGETYEVIAYFKDYEDGENRGPTTNVYVTDTAFGMYDSWTGAIIEFPLK